MLLLFCLCVVTLSSALDLTSPPGHLQAFACCGEHVPIREHKGLLTPSEFILEHVEPLRPVLMRGGAQQLSVFTKWTDEYLSEQGDKHGIVVNSETTKKELRPQPVQTTSLPEFLRQYKQSEYYMVDNVPNPLKKDVELPFSLQCEEITENLQDVFMWLSAGGTQSVVHTDDADNINCLLRGSKTFVLIDPSTIHVDSLIDREGGYSGVDADRVDYEKYPVLREARSMHVELQAGDCLYIPYKWVHQVRSKGLNLAVNFFFYHAALYQLDLDECNSHFNRNSTLDAVRLLPLETLLNGEDTDTLRHLFLRQVRRYGGDLSSFSYATLHTIAMFASENEENYLTLMKRDFRTELSKIFRLVDTDGSASVEETEVVALTIEDWQEVRGYIGDILKQLGAKIRKLTHSFRNKDEL